MLVVFRSVESIRRFSHIVDIGAKGPNSSLSLSRRGLLRRSRMTSSDSISPHVSEWTVVVVVSLVQPSLVGRPASESESE